jgi:hypothetical protein
MIHHVFSRYLRVHFTKIHQHLKEEELGGVTCFHQLKKEGGERIRIRVLRGGLLHYVRVLLGRPHAA